LTIGAGIPTRTEGGVLYHMMLFQPGKPRETYSKKYLHADEEPFFVSGPNILTSRYSGGHAGGGPLPSVMRYPFPNMRKMLMRVAANIYVASCGKIHPGH